VDQIAFDGMRKHLLQDFTAIYHLDLHGNVRRNPKLSGTTHNVFGIQVGVGVTIAIRRASSETRGVYYFRVPEDWRREQKLRLMATAGSAEGLEWQELAPDERHTWLTEGMRPEFASFAALGTKEAKLQHDVNPETVFTTYCLGVSTNRDSTVYDFDRTKLVNRVQEFIEDYNAEVSRWVRSGRPQDIDGFLKYDRVKWSNALKVKLRRENVGEYEPALVRRAMYRPFCSQLLYYSPLLNDGYALFSRFFPTSGSESENVAIAVSDHGHREAFSVFASDRIPDLHVLAASDGFQCFPYYVYDEDGSNRRENITEWALAGFREAYGPDVTKRDIFHYVYGLLHHPAYRERYAENLKRELPRIPLVAGASAFQRCAEIGQRLMALHLGYETQPEYALRWVEHPEGSPDHRVTFHVRKMKLSADRAALLVNETLTLEGIPSACFDYRLGNRSALEWVIDQYQISEDKRSGITSDPNRADDPQYIVRLVGQVVTVSMQTVALVAALAAEVALPEPVAVPVAAE
jgi:predicted helicase